MDIKNFLFCYNWYLQRVYSRDFKTSSIFFQNKDTAEESYENLKYFIKNYLLTNVLQSDTDPISIYIDEYNKETLYNRTMTGDEFHEAIQESDANFYLDDIFKANQFLLFIDKIEYKLNQDYSELKKFKVQIHSSVLYDQSSLTIGGELIMKSDVDYVKVNEIFNLVLITPIFAQFNSEMTESNYEGAFLTTPNSKFNLLMETSNFLFLTVEKLATEKHYRILNFYEPNEIMDYWTKQNECTLDTELPNEGISKKILDLIPINHSYYDMGTICTCGIDSCMHTNSWIRRFPNSYSVPFTLTRWMYWDFEIKNNPYREDNPLKYSYKAYQAEQERYANEVIDKILDENGNDIALYRRGNIYPYWFLHPQFKFKPLWLMDDNDPIIRELEFERYRYSQL